MIEVMTPVGTQAPVPRRKRPGRGKRGETRFPEKSSIITRSMQRRRSLNPGKTIKSLPNISGLVVQAIAASASNGLTLTELKEVLSAKGYNVRRQSPRTQRKMHALVLKGAVVRMTHSDGSKFFVIRKHQSKASKIFENPKRTAGARKVRVGRRYGTCTGTKTKGEVEGAKSSADKTGEARQKLRIPNRRRRCPRKNGTGRRSQRLAQKAASSTSDNSDNKAEDQHCSSRSAASALKTTRNLRNRPASAEKSKRASSKSTSERSRSSKSNSTTSPKGVGKPYSKETPSAKKTRFCRSRDVSSAKEQNSMGKAAFPPRRPKRRARRRR
ncbi:histone H1.5-like [Podarcis raffonei]|uniref:histone H1.5-like n=1 Tax=Podarcis raffonei TaxID=65483 RepID=UPI0023295619|nr:histone H1.5-like [Podarcis raffonei]